MKRTPLRVTPQSAKTAVKVKLKKCRICPEMFEKRSMGHVACSPACAEVVALRNREKEARRLAMLDRAETTARRQKLKSISDFLKEAQVEFNKFIRERDAHLPCISCGRFHQGSWDAGHYRSVGAMSSLRFNEDNCHRQCVPCNQHKSGNAIEYRIGLVKRIGPERVALLEGPQPVAKWSEDEIKAIRATYKAKLKELQASNKGAA